MIDLTNCKVIPGISDLQKEFYKVYINARNNLIIRPSLKMIIS